MPVPLTFDSPFLFLSPFERPDWRLARALRRHGATVAVDIGRDEESWSGLPAQIARHGLSGVGLRVPDHADLARLPASGDIAFLILQPGLEAETIPERLRRMPWIAQVCSVEEAEAAIAAGARGVVGKGGESGGLVGTEGSFVLLQRLLERAERTVPVWCQGGIGLQAAGLALAAGAAGVVVDAILALTAESSLPQALRGALETLDGAEIRAAAGYRFYLHPKSGARLDAKTLGGWSGAQVREALRGRGTAAQPPLPAGAVAAMGQDAALASIAAAEYPTVDALLAGLRLRAAGQLHQARHLRVLDEHNPWAQAHRTRYPIAQGPMTRVSDTAAFCCAVAEAGGLPFLALSLMRPEACRALLEETRERIGDRPWGVGLLGFAPAEVLNPQLALVQRLRPPVVLLAGGRPSQSRPLVEMGIPTYLHVPSPALLELFLKEGATHFVLEGRECGGHVGPRFSLVLWQQALAILLRAPDPERIQVLFAGGIHDDRSGAMVAAMAAPLAARGAKIGVLMGTAYIATAEAVSCGAIVAGFQQRALAGRETVLMETAPGHAVRCLPSEHVQRFTREKERLQAAGADPKQITAALEKLNVGRLRIATKGVARQGDALIPVTGERQEQDGIFMIGQAIAAIAAKPARRRAATVAELHDRVSRGAARRLAAVASPPPAASGPRPEPVAIVGMACAYPGAPDLDTYWANILEGRDAVREVPRDRWNAALYYRAGTPQKGKTPSKWGGFLDAIPFDPLEYGIPPHSLAAIEPVQLLSLAVAARALRDAGYAPGEDDGRHQRTSVIFAAEGTANLSTRYKFRSLFPQYCGDLPPALERVLPSLTEDSFPGVLNNVIAGRIANRLGFGGVNYSVDAACASSLVAVEAALRELRGGTSDLVLAGGADCNAGIPEFLMFASAGALSPTGHCRSFDAAADGIALGEGVGVVVLKRLSDAEHDGDRIYAVVDGIGGSSDGKGLGLTAPRSKGQVLSLQRAYRQAGVLPAEVGLVEAHGTGTVVGDRTELETLETVYNAGGALPGTVALGSVKSQIGHLKGAAGLAGLIKAAKALYHQTLPGTPHIRTPNDAYHPGRSPFTLSPEPRPWGPLRRRAAVSAFGFGGTNFHAVLSAAAVEPRFGSNLFPAELFAFRGETPAEAQALMRKLSEWNSRAAAAAPLRDAAHAVWKAGHGPVQVAFVAGDRATLERHLRAAVEGEQSPRVHRRGGAAGKIAWLFPGQGSQFPGMLRDLFVYFPPLQALLTAERDYTGVLFPPSAYDEETRARQQAWFADTRQAQPALAIVELALARWLAALGLTPDMAAGHSFGELAALASAGAFDAPNLLALVRFRAEAIREAAQGPDGKRDAGRMAAINAGADALRAVLRAFPNLVLANFNGPEQTVISGPTAELRRACDHLRTLGMSAKELPTPCAFHSPLVADAVPRFAAALEPFPPAPLAWPVYANTSAAPHSADAAALRASLARHIASPVRFLEEVERLYADGARVFLEVGPGSTLSRLVRRILRDRPHHVIPVTESAPPGGSLVSLLEAAAQTAVLRDGFDAEPLFAGRTGKLDLEHPAVLPAHVWMVNGARAWPNQGPPPRHAGEPVLDPVVRFDREAAAAIPAPAQTNAAGSASHPAGAGQTGNTDADAGLIEFLTNMRQLVQAQRDVLMSYYGAVPPQPAAGAPNLIAPPPELPAAQPPLLATPPVGRLAAEHRSAAGDARSAQGIFKLLPEDTTIRRRGSPRPVPPQGPPPAAKSSPSPSVAALLLGIVSERTGYPAEMLGLDLDLEADLSIDSIKRVEIIGEFASRLASSTNFRIADALIERLTTGKTLRAMLATLDAERPIAPAPQPSSAAPAEKFGGETESEAAPGLDDVKAMLLDIVSASTGYPVDALDLDLDLEADLSIDSIKRIEIVARLLDQLGPQVPAGVRDGLQETLATRTSLRSMLAALPGATQAPHPGPAPAPSAAAANTSPPGTPRTGSPAAPVRRYVLRLEPASLLTVQPSLCGRSFVITDDGGVVAPRLVERLRQQGAEAQLLSWPEAQACEEAVWQHSDALIHLWPLNPASRFEDVKPLFSIVRGIMPAGLLLASGAGRGCSEIGSDPPLWPNGGRFAGARGAGLAGLAHVLAREYPNASVRSVDLDLTQAPEMLASALEREIAALHASPEPDATDVEVVYRAGKRWRRKPLEQALPPGDGSGPRLDRDSVVLITGGARGIAARLARTLAERYRCRLEIVGRSPLPPAIESERTRGVAPAELRRTLAAGEPGLPVREIERRARAVQREREVRETLAALRAAGSEVRYTALDVRDGRALAAFAARLYQERGRIDGVFHAAGVIEDKRAAAKSDASFARVFDTKVEAARTLRRSLRGDLRFVVLYSSVAALAGNEGQCDYAAANAVLDQVALDWQAEIAGHVLSVNWGPWHGAGMVDEALEAKFAHLGIGLIPLDEGVEALLRELAAGRKPDTQIVLMSAGPERILPPAGSKAERHAASRAAPAGAGYA